MTFEIIDASLKSLYLREKLFINGSKVMSVGLWRMDSSSVL